MSLSLDIMPGYPIPVTTMPTRFPDQEYFISCKVVDAADEESHILSFETQQNISLKGAEIFTRINQFPLYKYDKVDDRVVRKAGKYKELMSLVVSYKVKPDDSFTTLHEEKIEGKKPYNSSIKVKFDKDVLVPKGVFCRIKVNVVNSSEYLPEYAVLIDRDPFLASLESVDGNNAAVSGIRFDRLGRPDDEAEWSESEEDDGFICIIKNVEYSVVN